MVEVRGLGELRQIRLSVAGQALGATGKGKAGTTFITPSSLTNTIPCLDAEPIPVHPPLPPSSHPFAPCR